jgi:hypothetical protein
LYTDLLLDGGILYAIYSSAWEEDFFVPSPLQQNI